MVSGLLVTGHLAQLSYPYFIGVAGVGFHLLWQIWTADVNSPSNLWKRFSSNAYVGAAVTASIIAGHIVI